MATKEITDNHPRSKVQRNQSRSPKTACWLFLRTLYGSERCGWRQATQRSDIARSPRRSGRTPPGTSPNALTHRPPPSLDHPPKNHSFRGFLRRSTGMRHSDPHPLLPVPRSGIRPVMVRLRRETARPSTVDGRPVSRGNRWRHSGDLGSGRRGSREKGGWWAGRDWRRFPGRLGRRGWRDPRKRPTRGPGWGRCVGVEADGEWWWREWTAWDHRIHTRRGASVRRKLECRPARKRRRK